MVKVVKLDDDRIETPAKDSIQLSERKSLVKRLSNEKVIDNRIEVTETRFLEEIDYLESLKSEIDSEDLPSLGAKIASLTLELEKVQIRRRKDLLENIVNWDHLQALSEFFVRKLTEVFDDLDVDAEVEDQIMDTFTKSLSNWEAEVQKSGILEKKKS